jgi:hypothetical protein
MDELLWIGSESNSIEWSDEINKYVLKQLSDNPFFSSWKIMTEGFVPSKEKAYDFDKALKILCGKKEKVCVHFFEKNIGFKENSFYISRDKNFNGFMIQLKKEVLLKKSVQLFQEYVTEIALITPAFKRLFISPGSISAETQKKHNIPQEKSIFSYMSWLNVLSPLAYNGYYEKEDLLKAPFYRVEEIKKDIILIQAYKDPFDIENEESLHYLRNGVAYLNKNIVFLKGKDE